MSKDKKIKWVLDSEVYWNGEVKDGEVINETMEIKKAGDIKIKISKLKTK
jgi:hypothetical protein